MASIYQRKGRGDRHYLHLLEEIRDELRALVRLEEARRHMDDGTPLSRAAAARVLGIDLKTTLAPLIEARKIRTVPWTRGEVRIPVSEIRRLQRDGIPAVETPKTSMRAPRVPASDEGESFSKIKIK